MNQIDGEAIPRLLQRVDSLVREIVVNIINSDDLNLVPTFRDLHLLIDQYSDSKVLHGLNHVASVMVAQYPNEALLWLEIVGEVLERFEGGLHDAMYITSIVASKHDQIDGMTCAEFYDLIFHILHISKMKIRKVQDAKAIKRSWQSVELQGYLGSLDIFSIRHAQLIEACEFEEQFQALQDDLEELPVMMGLSPISSMFAVAHFHPESIDSPNGSGMKISWQLLRFLQWCLHALACYPKSSGVRTPAVETHARGVLAAAEGRRSCLWQPAPR